VGSGFISKHSFGHKQFVILKVLKEYHSKFVMKFFAMHGKNIAAVDMFNF
jgi:hypothetical protein